jgi:glucose-6-phosphate isomerase
MWGPVGLALMIGIGPARFAEMLAGAAAMDAHFRTAPLACNMPVMLALSGMWHAQVAGHATRAVLPYDQRLHLLPAYLQQLEMESNGKGVTMAGARLGVASGPVVWGAPGTNGQHAFHQLLHQGTQIVPAEFLIAARGHEAELAHHHRILVANCLAQSEALMRGRSEAEAEALMRRAGLSEAEARRLAPHRAFPGNRPSVTLAYPQLTPFVLGQIVALYEHRVFVEGVCLGINSFDQWGVELGKERAVALLPLVEGRAEAAPAADPSTAALVEFLRRG